ncbi:MAG: hypothetical protein RBR23_03250 [Arcobacteraceae bacterium]|jgi:hypothetical protein|nr:hypothetical protein [Arcobacteraceae bacterium]
MVRLVATDFKTKEASEAFYLNEKFDASQKIFTYSFFKKYSLYMSRYLGNYKIYSLNLLSKKYLNDNEFLIYITDEEFLVLFNHKTIYASKINLHYITDDIIKSILITKHLVAILNIDDTQKKLNYLIDSRYKYAIENIVKENIKINDTVIAQSLGDIEELTMPMNELVNTKTHYLRLAFVSGLLITVFWVIGFGLDIVSNKVFFNTSLDDLRSEVDFESRALIRQQKILDTHLSQYNEVTKCISHQNTEVKQ